MGRYIDSLVMDYAMVPEDVYFSNWKNYSMEYHFHSLGGIEFNYVTGGECEYYIEDKCVPLKKKNLLIINSMLPHKLVFTSEEPCLILGLACGEYPLQAGYLSVGNLIEAYSDVKGFFEQLDDYLLIKDGHLFFEIMESIWREVHDEWNPAYLQMECNRLLVKLARYVQKQDYETVEYVAKAKTFMTYHYFEIESIEDIATDIGISKVYLQRIFKKYTGETIWQYLMKIRLEKAAMLLQTSNIPIGELDSLIGIHSRQSFYQNFTKYYQMSPSEYRKICIRNVKNSNLK